MVDEKHNQIILQTADEKRNLIILQRVNEKHNLIEFFYQIVT